MNRPGQVAFPGLGIRQRLTVSRGDGAAELYIPENSGLVGKTLDCSGLREEDIHVTNPTRGVKAISNPERPRVLEPGDRLLCYGELEGMRHLIPERTRRKRRVRARRLEGQLHELDSV